MESIVFFIMGHASGLITGAAACYVVMTYKKQEREEKEIFASFDKPYEVETGIYHPKKDSTEMERGGSEAAKEREHIALLKEAENEDETIEAFGHRIRMYKRRNA